MANLNDMSTEQVVERFRSRRGVAADQPAPQVEYSADYQRQMSEIDSDKRRSPEQKTKAKQLLSAAAMSRIGK